MLNRTLRSKKEIEEIYERHYEMVYRICYAFMKTPSEAEDAVSETFLRFIRKAPAFESCEHEKAWLIRTASNVCRNELKHWRRKCSDIESAEGTQAAALPRIDETINTVMSLPERYKTAVYLYYYEGYTSSEIADILHKPKSTVRNYLSEARRLLKERLGEDFYEE